MVTSNNGIIDVGMSKCTVYVNGVEQTISNGTVNGLQFGIVNYVCNDKVGYFISKLSCHNCGLFCHANELIEGCQAFAVPLIVGLVIGIIMSLTIFFVLRNLLGDLMLKVLFRVNTCRQMAQDKKHKKQMDSLNDMTGERKPYKFKDSYQLNEIGRVRVANNRSKLSMPLLTLTIIGLMTVSHASDKTLFMHSSGRICEDSICTDSEMINMYLQTGQAIVLEDDMGQKVEFRAKSTYYRYRYSYAYDTSDYDIIVDSTWRCKGLGGYCWNGNCNADSKFPLFKNQSGITRYGCHVDTLGCNTYCAHQTSCTWYSAKVLPKGRKYPVYKFQSRIWEVIIEILRNGYKTNNVINANNPILNLDNIGRPNGSIPILINSFLAEDYGFPEYMLLIDELMYQVDACMVDQPMMDRIGDIQIDKSGEMAYPIDRLQCSSSSCRTSCNVMESPLSRLVKNKNGMIGSKHTEVVKGYIHETKYQLDSSLNVMLQLNGFKQLDYSPAYCKFEVLDTFACKGCNVKPYVLLQAVNIKHDGLMSITDNCTIETKVVPCSNEPVHLSMNEMPDNCVIHISRTNQTLGVNFKYVLLGNVHKMRSHMSYSSAEEVGSLLSSESFITGLISSATSIFSLGIVFTLLLKLFYIYEMSRMTEKVDHANA